MVHYDACPICLSHNISKDFQAKDNTVTNDIFWVWKCENCSAKFTQDVAGEEGIGRYYQSDNYVSHSDTKKGLINSLYHNVRSFTLGIKRKLIIKETSKTNGSLLDVGCGTGAFINAMKIAGWSVTGLEPDSTAAQKAESLYGIKPKSPTALFDFSGELFDAITMWHVLEHVHRLDDYILQFKKILKPGGVLVIAVPNHTSYDAAFYKENWAAYDVPRHLYHFSPQSMACLMERHQLKIKKVKPMWFDSFYVSMLSEGYRFKKNNLLRAIMIGLVSNIKTIFNSRKCSSVIYIITHQEHSR